MAQLSTMEQIFDIISENDGIVGIHARPGIGKTTFMLQIVDEVNKRKDGTAIIFSMAESEAQLMHRMQQMNASLDRVVIDDAPHPTSEHIETRIKQVGAVSILCIDYLQLLGNEAKVRLMQIAEKYSIPILIIWVLPRSSEGNANKEQEMFRQDFLAFMEQNESVTELIVKKGWNYDPVNIFMEWVDQKTKFKF